MYAVPLRIVIAT